MDNSFEHSGTDQEFGIIKSQIFDLVIILRLFRSISVSASGLM